MENLVASLQVDEFAPGRYRISDGVTHCYLFAGDASALLLDTGFGQAPIGDTVRSLTKLPLILVNSHSHADHIMGNGQFPDVPVYVQAEGAGRVPGAIPIIEGFCFNLGGLFLRVLETPGHTPDSITLADEGIHALFTGDSVELFHGGVRMLEEEIASVKKLLVLKDRYPDLYPSHGQVPIQMDQRVDDLLTCLQKIKAGSLEGTPLRLQLPPDIDIQTFEYEYKGINLNYNPALGPWA